MAVLHIEGLCAHSTGGKRAGVWVTPLYRLEWDEATNAVDKIESTKAIKKIDRLSQPSESLRSPTNM
jgi:hypothetical protein